MTGNNLNKPFHIQIVFALIFVEKRKQIKLVLE